MSIIHVNQLRDRIVKLLGEHLDLPDVADASPEMREAVQLSRGLAAYAIHVLSGSTPEVAANSVTDGGNDNGLDAVYYDESNKRLYLVQSKWIKDGNGEPENGDVKKYVAGVRDLFNLQFDRFNERVGQKQAEIVRALNDPATRYEVVLAYSGGSGLSTHSRRDLDDLALEMNDTSEVVFTTVLRQGELHATLAAGVTGEPIKLEVGLRAWGKKEAPQEAFYGQVSGDQVASWWRQFRGRLFAGNLRNVLGDTDVNAEMRQTIEQRPDQFWYFNNGITMVARRATRAMAGGAAHDFATFHCDDVSIVNGAQTVGSIGKASEAGLQRLEEVSISLRIIVRGDDKAFADTVTRTNNRQNRIENRDFVTLDPEQIRIRNELAIDGIDYQLARSEQSMRSDTAFDLVESTTALACASGKTRLATQLKREIGKLWEDLDRAPYKELFNPSVHGAVVWRFVQVQRRIDRAVDSAIRRSGVPYHPKRYPISTHGNRLIAALVFQQLPATKLTEAAVVIDDVASEERVTALVDTILQALIDAVELKYKYSILPTLFKNISKCEDLAERVRAKLQAAST